MASFRIHGSRVAPFDDLVLRAAVAAYLGRYSGRTRVHTESDLRVFLRWCTDHELDPLALVGVDIERGVRWLQDVRATSRPPSPGAYPFRAPVSGWYGLVVIQSQMDGTAPADFPTVLLRQT